MAQDDIKRSYVYRHIKPNGETFYIGIGTRKDRAYSKKGRNSYWKNIVSKYGYEVQILTTNLTRQEACDLEILLIDYYGRKDLGTGCLVNMTNGGDSGNFGIIHTDEWRKNNSNAKKGNTYKRGKKASLETKDKMSKSRIGNKSARRNLILDTETGIFYYNTQEASDVYNILYNTLSRYLNGKRKNKTNLIKC